MKILYLHQYFNTPRNSGGTRSYEMARRLVAAGHEVTMITTSAALGDTWAPTSGWHSHLVDGIHVEVLKVPYDNAMSYAQRIKAFFEFALGASWHVRKFQADVVFATSTPLTIIFPGLAAKIWHRIPLVFEVRDLWPELPIAVGALRNPLLKWAAQALEWVAYHASSHIVALSRGMADGVVRRGIPPSKVTVIPNSCDVELFDVPPQSGEWVRKKLGLTPEQPLILYAGTFGLINNVGYLVKVAAAACATAPDMRFLLVGSGAEVSKVTVQAEQLGVLNQVLFIWPPLPKMRIPDVFAAATVTTSTVIPLKALENNSANKFFDALAAGKPIAVNHEGWQADLIREQAVGVVLPADDPQQAASILADFVHDPERVRKAGAAAHHLAHHVYRRDLLYAQLEQVLQDAVEQQ